MCRRPALPLVLLSLVFPAGPSPAQPPRKEQLNFVFVLIDDLGWRDLGC